MECYTNGTYNSRLENDYAEKAVKLIYDNLYAAYKDGGDMNARQNMQEAAFLAGRAFTRGCVGYVHAIGHTLGGLYGVPHGLAMAVILPHVMRYFGASVEPKLSRLADICGLSGSCDREKGRRLHPLDRPSEREYRYPGQLGYDKRRGYSSDHKVGD